MIPLTSPQQTSRAQKDIVMVSFFYFCRVNRN